MLWERMSATNDALQAQAEQIAETVRQVGELSGAVRELAANDTAHKERFDMMQTDIREVRAELRQQQTSLGDLKAEIAKSVGESVALALKESRESERHTNALFDAIAARSQAILGGILMAVLGGVISWVVWHGL